MNSFTEKANFIWSAGDLIRGPYRPNQYKDVMLPLTVLRGLGCLLEPTKAKVLAQQKELSGGKVKALSQSYPASPAYRSTTRAGLRF
jgi:type I restriction enzyme M protein